MIRVREGLNGWESLFESEKFRVSEYEVFVVDLI
jgi:hypothetical protein